MVLSVDDDPINQVQCVCPYIIRQAIMVPATLHACGVVAQRCNGTHPAGAAARVRLRSQRVVENLSSER
jgi:hypothetical protein